MILYQVGSRNGEILCPVERKSKSIVQRIKENFRVVLVEIVSVKMVIREVPLDWYKILREVLKG